MTLSRTAALALALAALTAGNLAAQDARLRGRLDAPTAARIQLIVDSAGAAGLPTEPLVQKALEGASKNVPSDRIVETVRSLRARLVAARDALGPDTPAADLTAAAAALYAGTSAATLRRMQAARPGRPLALPFAVLADLVQQGVAVDTAAALMHDLTTAGVSDAELAQLLLLVQQDVQAGAPPVAAATTRAQGVLARVGRGDWSPP